MRLRDRDVAGIRAAAEQVFHDRATVRLFGSRVDDCARGGDIDLHIQADASDLSEANKARFRRLLARNLGERSIDTIFMSRDMPVTGIHAVALSKGVRL